MVKRFLSILGISILAVCLFTFPFFLSGGHAQDDLVLVTLETSKGDIVLELNRTKAPITVANFLQYMNEGFYKGTIFHRVEKNFVIQGGGFDKNMNPKPTRAPIQNEAGNGLSNKAYTIAMARTDNPDSATSQFYINLKDNLFLDKSASSAGYAVFGKVVEGKDVVDAISNVTTTTIAGYPNVPVKPVLVNGDSGSDSDSTCFIGTLR